jgi:DNA polymerase-1
MRHHIFETSDTYPIALLMKPVAFSKGELLNNYVVPLNQLGVQTQDIIAFTLEYGNQGKATAKLIKEYLAELLPALDSIGTKHLYVTDGAYFKVLAGQAKAEPHHGYALPCKVKGFEHMQVILGINYQSLIYNPDLQAKMQLGLNALAGSHQGNYQALGKGIIHSAQYPEGVQAIAEALKSLHQYPSLTCDIEAFSLDFWDAGIGTIAFAWDQHNGMAFACDYQPLDPGQKLGFGVYLRNPEVHALLREFFETYQGELTFHHAGYDLKPIIYNLWMKDLLDRVGLLDGLHIMTRKLHDTKIIAYLATNSTAGNELGLKTLAHPFAGNWAKDDIKDIRRIPLKELLEYNLVDALSTHYVRNQYEPTMIQDQQQQLYQTLMMPSQKLITQMELVGMPMSRKRIKEVKAELQEIQQQHLDTIQNSSIISVMNLLVQTKKMNDANAKLKTKQHPLSKFADERFNPNSGPQLQVLLYEQMGLPVIDLTDTKQPATGAETIEKLINHTNEPSYKALLSALIEYGKVTKILSTFIPAFEGAVGKDDSDTVWLHGSFNLGGTVSGRLSSSDPNLQNIPAGSKYGKLIKSCFCAPVGWLFCGADFNSLEDYISALTTKDPNKLDVYIKGFDGHCLRAAYYFRDQLPQIDLADPKSVNTIKDAYPVLRQESKAPTFLLTYGGTYHGMMSNLGWPEDKSKAIEANYHHLYQVSDQYVQKRLEQASKDGFVEVAFGLRVRTPLLKQVVFKGYKMPLEAAAEGRTAGNALGQSYGLLNNRAAVEFWQKVWDSQFRYDILPSALIHDAIYAVTKDDLEALTFANNELIKSMRWQNLPEIQHPTVKLGAAIDVFWPTWANAITLPNEATPDQILEVCAKGKQKYLDKHRA